MATDDIWDNVLAKLTTAADKAGAVDWSLSVDSTIACAHQYATNATRSQGAGSNYTNLQEEPPDRGIGRSHGGLSTKGHQRFNSKRLPILTLVTPGQFGDSPMFLPLCIPSDFGRPRTRPDTVHGDKAYSSRAIRAHLRERGIKEVLARRRATANDVDHEATDRPG